jgi:hypothetical protein
MSSASPNLVHQVLHGYNDGHRLLCSSLKLPKSAERTMLPLSDLSGQSAGTIDPYITGYPIKAISQYAFARTWLAPEIKRPGCVWTHTLLVNFDDLASFVHRNDLIDLFRRPIKEDELNYYRAPIELDDETIDVDYLNSEEFVYRLIYALVGEEADRVVVSVPSYSVAEREFLDVWRHLWPDQQRCFTFCTGVKSPRTLDGQLFNLQAVNEKDLIRFKRRTEDFKVRYIEFDLAHEYIEQHDSWIKTFIATQQSSVGILAQRVLPLNFQNTKVIVDLLTQHSNQSDFASKVIAYLASKFPSVVSGSDLKAFLLGRDDPLQLSDFAILHGITLSDKHDSFDPLQLHIAERASNIWKTPEKAIQLSNIALERLESDFAANVLSGLSASVPSTSLNELIVSKPDAFDFYVNANPSLSISPEIWQVPQEFEYRVVNAIAGHACKLSEHRKAIVTNALAARLDQGWELLLEAFGLPATEDVLDAIEFGGYSSIPESCEIALSRTPAAICDWIRRRSRFSAGTSNIVLSLAMKIAATGQIEIESDLLKVIVANFDKFSIDLHVSVKLLAVAFAEKQESFQFLAELSLDPVYFAIAHAQISDFDWEVLNQIVPKVEWWRGWDRCARVRKAIAEKYLFSNWQVESLFRITSSDALFEGVVKEIAKHENGYKFLKHAAKFPSTTFRKKCLKKATHESSD